jgi:TPR repeat protein
VAGAPSPVTGWAVWGRPLGWLALIAFGPLALLPTPLSPLAVTWFVLLLLGAWILLVAAFIGAVAGAATPVTVWLEGRLRAWVVRFAPDPEALWLHWARQAHRIAMAQLCLDRAARLGGAEGLFQDGLAYLEGGFGAGGQIAGAERMARAAGLGHPEAAYWHAEALRTGRGCRMDSDAARSWYQRSASAGFGPAAFWLAAAYVAGDGFPVDPDQAQRWSQAAARLSPSAPLSRSLLRHDAAPEDPLIRLGAGVVGSLEAAAERAVAHRGGRWALGVGTALLAGLGLGVPIILFLAGASGLFYLPLLMLVPPGLMLTWQAWQLRREGPQRGRDRLREAAEGGDPEACFQLGLAYQKGTAHLPRDAQSATVWFQKAAEAGHRGAMRALAQAYLSGHGVLRNPREATRWAEEASRPARSR